jgi:hypothetical protein
MSEDEGASGAEDFLRLCQRRALVHVEGGDPHAAMQSLFSDVMKRPDMRDHAVLQALRGLLLECSEGQARQAIELIPRVIEDGGLTAETIESVTRLSLEAHEVEVARYQAARASGDR